MSDAGRVGLMADLAIVALLAAAAAPSAQSGLPNPYRPVKGIADGGGPFVPGGEWARLPGGREMGPPASVHVDVDGESIWALIRCDETSPVPVAQGGRFGLDCLGPDNKIKNIDTIFKFDAKGNVVKSFGAGMFIWPHGLDVDRDGNVWVTDARAPSAEDLKKFPGEENKGSVVVKFSPDGKVLMTLGKPGVRGDPPDALTDPTDVVTDARTGDVYVAESHTDVSDPNLVARISVFDRRGKFLRIIGKTGSGPGEFRTPHALEFDSQGRLIVADRHNHRIQILSKDGKFIAEYDDFGRTSGLAIDGNDVIYTADSESSERVHPGWQRGIRIGSLKDGKVTIFIPPHMAPNSADGAMGEGIAIDAAGNVYTAEAQLRGVTKYIKQ